MPGAAPALATWAERDTEGFSRCLHDMTAGATQSGHATPSDVRFCRFGPEGRGTVVYMHSEQTVAILAVDDDGTVDVDLMAQRLTRIDWSRHLVRIDLGGVDTDVASILWDVALTFDGDGATQARFAGVGKPAPLVDRLEKSAGVWQTRQARDAFKTLLESASTRPQVVDRRDGERVYVVSEDVLRAFSEPLPTPELVEAFAHPEIDLRMELATRPAPRGAVDLGAGPADNWDA